MKKILFMVLGTVLLFGLVACGGNKVDDATAEKYIGNGENIVSLLNKKDFEEVHAQFDDNMSEKLPVKGLEELTPIIEESGNFEKIDKSSVEEDDEGMYIVVLVAKYSEKKRVFTISFNDDEEVAGLYVK